MLKNYILIAWRSLMKNRLFSFINIFGLALSVSVCMIVLVRIVDALEYDNFHTDSQLIYRINSKITNHQHESWTLASSPLPLGEALRNDSANITITKIYPVINVVASDHSREFAVNGAFIEPSFFEVFNFSILNGDPNNAINSANHVLLCQATAEKFYGNSDPRGKIITLGDLGEFEVTGVLKKPSAKSHIDYDVLVSMATVPLLENNGSLPKRLENWDTFEQGYTYVKLKDRLNPAIIDGMLLRIASEVNKAAIKSADVNTTATFSFVLQSLNDITPSSADINNNIGKGPSLGSLLAEAGIALVILMAACFNYTNLSVARALTRSKEVGIRKLSGAQRWQIILQYIIEAIIIALLALVIANCIFGLILEFKPFNDSYELVPAISLNLKIMAVFIAFAVFCGLLAGVVPAWILSAFKPARILRGIGNEKWMGNLSLRKMLMVFQFSLSLIILVFLTSFYQQFDFLAKADPGFNSKSIGMIPAGENASATMNALQRIPAIKSTAFTSGRFGNGVPVNASRQRQQEGTQLQQYVSDRAWIDMMHLIFVAGSNFSFHREDVVINEKAIAALGFENSNEAIGAKIYVRDSVQVNIKGVVRDFYENGFGNAIRPVLIAYSDSELSFIAVEIQSQTPDLKQQLEKEWKRQNPDHTFEMYWLDEELEKGNDQSAEISLLGFLGLVTITIASLGLLGLVVYTVETKRKEISIRKIIGASINQVMILLSGGFVKLLLLSGLIALPLGYMLSYLFLINFVNRISIGLIELSLCFGFLLSVGLAMIISQTWKAAVENPSNNIRRE